MSDGVTELQKATQNLSRAYNAYQASSFSKYFAAKLLPELNPDQQKMRITILRLNGDLIDTEFNEAMDLLTANWLEYKRATG